MHKHLSIYKIALLHLFTSVVCLVWHNSLFFLIGNTFCCIACLSFIYVSSLDISKSLNERKERIFFGLGLKRTQIVFASIGFLALHFIVLMNRYLEANLFILDVIWSTVIISLKIFEQNVASFCYHLLRKGKKVAVIGHSDHSDKIAETLKKRGKNFFYGQVDFKDDDYTENNDLSISSFINFAKLNSINEFYLPVHSQYQPNDIEVFTQEAAKHFIRVKLIPQDIKNNNIPVYKTYYLSGVPVLKKFDEPQSHLHNRIIKRAFDILISGLVTVFILSWLMPLIGILIRLESKGPFLFCQERSGRNNLPFNCMKFRSMKVNVESNVKQAVKDDTRVTKIGSFLRRTSLDELPQFINVLMGHMSIVGPRPHMLKHTEEYNDQVDQYMVRLWMKPGLTGWAQVNGYRGEIKHLGLIQKRVEHDIWYIENWSLSLDIKIFWQTLISVIKGDENAY